jgi:hypothetical protein
LGSILRDRVGHLEQDRSPALHSRQQGAATVAGYPEQRPRWGREGEAVDRWRFTVKRLVLIFSKEKETKGTYRYQEVEVAEREIAVGSLYLKKRRRSSTGSSTTR